MQIQDQLDQFEADLPVLQTGNFLRAFGMTFGQSDEESFRHGCCVAPSPRQKPLWLAALEATLEGASCAPGSASKGGGGAEGGFPNQVM